MDRRDFIKVLGAGAVGAIALPGQAMERPQRWKPTGHYAQEPMVTFMHPCLPKSTIEIRHFSGWEGSVPSFRRNGRAWIPDFSSRREEEWNSWCYPKPWPSQDLYVVDVGESVLVPLCPVNGYLPSAVIESAWEAAIAAGVKNPSVHCLTLYKHVQPGEYVNVNACAAFVSEFPTVPE